MRNIEDNVYTGQPRPELDAAWRQIIERESLHPNWCCI